MVVGSGSIKEWLIIVDYIIGQSCGGKLGEVHSLIKSLIFSNGES